MLSLQLRIAVLALLPLLIWGAYRSLPDERAQLLKQPVEIGVEHAGGGSISITHSLGGRIHFVDIGNDGEGMMHISIPDDWERGEVRGAPLASLVADAPSFGFRRWSIPPGATVSYRTPYEWKNIAVNNPSGELLRIKLTTIDLARNATDMNVYLLDENRLELSL